MKKSLLIALLSLSINAHAQFDIIGIIRAGIKKVIVAVDLKIQKLQNKTIWLQNAQKVVENQLSKLKLTEIGDWADRQKKLYKDYFDELRKVKTALTYYHKVKDVIADQAAMIAEYKSAWALFQQDRNFSRGELEYMEMIYTGMLNESMKSIDQLMLVINALSTQMTDAKRMEITNTAAVSVEQSFLDLKDFNNQNKVLSVQRSAARGEIDYVKKLYGL